MHDDRENTSMSNEFVLKIESGSTRDRDEIDHYLILQITEVSTKFRKFVLNSCEHAHKQVTLQASDNNEHCVTIKLASPFNDTSGNLKTGTFMKLQQFQILRCSDDTGK